MADAVLIETYAECIRGKAASGGRFAFVTHNKSDFSIENGNHKLPHPDFASLFSRIKSLYFINLPEALRRVEPSLVTDIMLEHSWTQEPRGLTEILEAEDLLFNQVWYNRHWNLRIGIEKGNIKVVDKETYPRPPGRRRRSGGMCGKGLEGRRGSRAPLRQEEPRTVGRLRVGHDQRQALRTSVGLGRRVGHAGHVEYVGSGSMGEQLRQSFDIPCPSSGAQQRLAADRRQPPPRCGFRQQLKAGVRVRRDKPAQC